jgi:hypothetical protein
VRIGESRRDALADGLMLRDAVLIGYPFPGSPFRGAHDTVTSRSALCYPYLRFQRYTLRAVNERLGHTCNEVPAFPFQVIRFRVVSPFKTWRASPLILVCLEDFGHFFVVSYEALELVCELACRRRWRAAQRLVLGQVRCGEITDLYRPVTRSRGLLDPTFRRRRACGARRHQEAHHGRYPQCRLHDVNSSPHGPPASPVGGD